jgi:hypothetical protein
VFRIPLVYDTEATHDAVWRSTCLILTALGHALADDRHLRSPARRRHRPVAFGQTS